MIFSDTVVLMFAKAPIKGQVNTRLIPDIGEQAATQLQYDFIHQRLTMLTQSDLCDVRLMCSPDKQQKIFLQCEKKYSISLHQQCGENLGQRMLSGIKSALNDYKYCLVIGTDAPALNAPIILQAITALHNNVEVVFVPAEDGGFVLVGMREATELLFQNIEWGTADVMQQSRDKLDESGLSYTELETSWDVDRLEDYQRYLAEGY